MIDSPYLQHSTRASEQLPLLTKCRGPGKGGCSPATPDEEVVEVARQVASGAVQYARFVAAGGRTH